MMEHIDKIRTLWEQACKERDQVIAELDRLDAEATRATDDLRKRWDSASEAHARKHGLYLNIIAERDSALVELKDRAEELDAERIGNEAEITDLRNRLNHMTADRDYYKYHARSDELGE